MSIRNNIRLTLVVALLLANAEISFSQVDKTRQLADWLTGTFSSEKQSKEDTTYFHINLEISRIWKDRSDGIWLYVEQAMATMKEKPYRQRVYRLRKTNENQFESAIFTIPEPLRFAGHPEKVNELSIDSIQEKGGCAVYLVWDEMEGAFVGKTGEKSCPSELRGASYATSEVRLSNASMISWDRGFNEKGEQVWGAEKGGYIFVKQKN